MKKKQYREIICNQTDLIKSLQEQNKALKKSVVEGRRARLKAIGGLSDLSIRMKDECMIPESEVVQMCIEAVKRAYV